MFEKFMNNLTDKANIIKDKANTIKEENNHYKELLNTTTTFTNLFPIPELNTKPSQHKVTTITTECPDINKEKASLIAKLIPIEETFLSIIYSKEIKTNKEYYLIPTNKYLWVINPNTYGAYPYQNIPCQIIKSNLIGKTILLNNILLEVTGNDTKINNLVSILINPTIRENIIKEKTNYLCGIVPIYQNINNIYSGISLDNNSNIVFHNQEQNYKCTILDIDYYEILLDNSPVFSSKSNTANKITNFQNSCYQISIRITTKDNNSIILPILKPNSLNTKYQRNDTVFQTNLNFAQELINKLKNLTQNNY